MLGSPLPRILQRSCPWGPLGTAGSNVEALWWAAPAPRGLAVGPREQPRDPPHGEATAPAAQRLVGDSGPKEAAPLLWLLETCRSISVGFTSSGRLWAAPLPHTQPPSSWNPRPSREPVRSWGLYQVCGGMG